MFNQPCVILFSSSTRNTNANNYADTYNSSKSVDTSSTGTDDSYNSLDDRSSVDIDTEVRLQTVTFAHWFVSQILHIIGGEANDDCQHRLISDVDKFVRRLVDLADVIRRPVGTLLANLYCKESPTVDVVDTKGDVHSRISLKSCNRC